MIIAEQKPLAEIAREISGFGKVLVLGCGTCVTVSFSGGQREVTLLASSLRLKNRVDGKDQALSELTVQRQCEWEFLDSIADEIKAADIVLSIGCGVGVQAIAERFPGVMVVPGLDTSFMGMPVAPGEWEARCAGCGQCTLARTGGICPIVRCSKGLLNGPCGGSVDGKCEIGGGATPCGWDLILKRLEALGRLEELEEIEPPKDWRTFTGQGSRKIVREELRVKS